VSGRDGEGRVDPKGGTGLEPNPGVDDRFDDALGRAARSLVTEGLPEGILDPAVSESLGRPAKVEDERGRRRIPGFAVAGAALVVLLLAAATLAPNLLLPGGSQATPAPTASVGPSPILVFRSTAEIRADLVLLHYACVDGAGDAPVEPGADGVAREAAVCIAPGDAGPLTAVVIVGESIDGRVVEVHAKADIVGFDIPASRRSVAATLAKAVAVVVPEGLGNAVATWVANNVPVVERKGALMVELRGYALRIERNGEGSYSLLVVPAAPA
jgi:hypothetical protein